MNLRFTIWDLRLISLVVLLQIIPLFSDALFAQEKIVNRNVDGDPRQIRNFVTCPVIRDSKTFPCWLVEYEGETYYLGQQGRSGSSFYPPQLKHQVLVEGRIKDGSRLCGGIVLDPVTISVMPELDLNCNTMLPAQDGLEPPPPIPYPKNEPFGDDTRNFTVLFDFESDFLSLHKTRIVGESVRIAKLNNLKSIEIRAFRGTSLLSNGQKLTEKEKIAELRASKIIDIFEGLGFMNENIKLIINTKPETADGINDAAKRRVEIRLF